MIGCCGSQRRRTRTEPSAPVSRSDPAGVVRDRAQPADRPGRGGGTPGRPDPGLIGRDQAPADAVRAGLPTGPHRDLPRRRRVVGHDRVMTPTTTTTGTGPPEPAVNDKPAVNDRAAVRAEAGEQVRRAAALWLTGDRTAVLGRQMVLSITR